MEEIGYLGIVKDDIRLPILARYSTSPQLSHEENLVGKLGGN